MKHFILKNLDKNKKKLCFFLLMFIFLLFIFEMILSFGGYFYFCIYSNLDNPEIEEDAFRILFLGESTTAGSYVKTDEAYPAQVEKILQQKYPNKKIISYNKGIGAIETTGILRILDKNMIKYKPNLIILMAGRNDIFVFDPEAFDNNYKRKHPEIKLLHLINVIKDFPIVERNYTFSVESKKDGDFRYIQTLKPPYYSYKPVIPVSQTISNLNSIIQTVHSYGSEIWFAGYLQPGTREVVNPVLRKIAEENHINYVGDYPEVDFIINRSLFADDGWHPGVEGHRIIAEKIAERVVKENVFDIRADK